MVKDKSEPPVVVGDELELSIESLGSKGDGISRIDGFVVFVSKSKDHNPQVGDKFKAKINRVFPKMAFSEILNKIE